MDTTIMVRVIAGVLALVVLGVIVFRRKKTA
jgi:LPXTG-motif cell wall-anchored protein